MKPSRRFSSSRDRLRRPRGPIFARQRRMPLSPILIVLAVLILIAALYTWSGGLILPYLGSLVVQASATPTAGPTPAPVFVEPVPAGESEIETTPTASPAAASLPEDYLPRTPVPSEESPEMPVSPAETIDPTQTPTTDTPAPSPAVTRVPEVSSELLYLTRGNLARWRLATREIAVLAEEVSSFAASANGKKVALLLDQHAGEDGRPVADLAVLDVETGRITVLLEDTSPPARLLISPDGRWIVYPERADGGALYAVSTSTAGEPARAGLCIEDAERPCDDLAWAPEGQALLWSDNRGIWLTDVARSDPQHIHENQMTIQDPRGRSSSVQVTFEAPRWSPAGRYALLQVRPLASNVSWEGLLDTRTGRLVEIPGSYVLDGPAAQVGWMANGNLWITFPGQDRPPRLEVWHVLPTRENLLDLAGTYPLVDTEPAASPEDDPPEDASENLLPAWLDQLDQRYFLLGLRSPGSPAPSIVYRLDLSYSKLSRLNMIPVDAEAVAWAPDGTGAVVTTSGDEVFYAPANGNSLFDLRRVLGADACCFTWLR